MLHHSKRSISVEPSKILIFLLQRVRLGDIPYPYSRKGNGDLDIGVFYISINISRSVTYSIWSSSVEVSFCPVAEPKYFDLLLILLRRFYLYFLCTMCVFIIPTFFYFPETKGLPLEEINRLFGDEVTEINLYAEDNDEKVSPVMVEETGNA